jgi:hypothetical protein
MSDYTTLIVLVAIILIACIGSWSWGFCHAARQRVEQWHLSIGSNEVRVVKMIERGGEFDDRRFKISKSFEFNPENPEQRAEALMKAEDVMVGLNHMVTQAREIERAARPSR